MARAIIRWSLDADFRNQTGVAVSKMLETAGAARIGTATWELDGPDTNQVLSLISNVIDLVRSPIGGGHLDHLWIYVDRTSAEWVDVE